MFDILGLVSARATEVPVPAPWRGRRPVGTGQVDAVLAARTRPLSATRDQVLPVIPPLAAFLPAGLRRGAVVLVDAADATSGATTLALALTAAASAAGSWVAAVGLADPGMVAVAELGIALDRLVLVPRPGPLWPEAVAAFLAGVDIVVARPPARARPDVARRLAARAREQRTALVVLAGERHGGGFGDGPDLHLRVEASTWHGVDAGHGHLRYRHVAVTAMGRRAARRPTRAELWLPAASGTPAALGTRRGLDTPRGSGAPGGGDGVEERCGEAVTGRVVSRPRARGGDG